MLLDAAWDAGIRHFDTARLYGTGDAEAVLGTFVKPHRDELTIVTKCGIQPMRANLASSSLKKVLRPLVRRSRRLVSASRQVAGRTVKGGQFDPTAVVSSLQTSLRQLQCEFVDALLLHDCHTTDWERDDTYAALENLMSQGLVGTYGTATSAAQTETILRESAAPPRVLQFESNIRDRQLGRILGASAGATTITFGVIGQGLGVVRDLLGDATTRTRWEDTLDLELRSQDDVAALLLGHALWQNPRGLVLFSSGDARRIARNVESTGTLSRQADRMIKADELLQGRAR
jgi:aryl-alcohol dehydrogenase-like predicted oxidoreductase